MTTENGLTPPSKARHHIERIRERRDYLVDKLAAIEAATGKDGADTFAAAEVRAIEWALPVLEAEWDYLVRMAAFNRSLPNSPETPRRRVPA